MGRENGRKRWGGVYNAGGNTHLDAGEAEDAGLLGLEPLVDLVRVVAVDVRLGHEREGDTVVELAELGDLLVVLGLLAAELESKAVSRVSAILQRVKPLPRSVRTFPRSACARSASGGGGVRRTWLHGKPRMTKP